MEKGSSSSSKKAHRKKKVPKRDAKQKPKQQQEQKPKVGDGKPKGKCYTCGQKGHWKTDCPKSKNDKNSGMSHLYVVETCLLACTTGTWCVNTGATRSSPYTRDTPNCIIIILPLLGHKSPRKVGLLAQVGLRYEKPSY